MDATANIMKTGKLQFHATFPVHTNTHTYQVTISKMPFTEWNQVISTLANVQITSGSIDRILLSGKATSMATEGNIIFEYRDLQATLFKKKKNGELKKAKLLSYITNSILRLHNPDNGETKPIAKEFYFKREPYQGQIMLWVGGLLDGIEATLLNNYLKEKVDDKEAAFIKLRKR
jgi:hypothetical protein